jgi:hypothetical protein
VGREDEMRRKISRAMAVLLYVLAVFPCYVLYCGAIGLIETAKDVGLLTKSIPEDLKGIWEGRFDP